MKLEISKKFTTEEIVAHLQNERSKGAKLRRGLVAIAGLLFGALFLILGGTFGQLWIALLSIPALSVTVIALLSVASNPPSLFFYPDSKLIILLTPWSGIVGSEQWDMNFLSSVGARLLPTSHNKSKIGVFFLYKNGEEEQILTKIGESVPQNCIKYINMMLKGKEVPEGNFRD